MLDVSHFAIQNANKILDLVFSIEEYLFILIAFLLSIFTLVSKRLSCTVKPNAPYFTNMLRPLSIFVFYLTSFALIAIALIILTLFTLAYIGNAVTYLLPIILPILEKIGVGLLFGLFVSLPLIWRLIPEWERGEGVTDPDEILKKLRSLTNYDPLPFINTKKGCFIGRNYLTKKPIYIPWSKVNQSHLQTLGATSSGKNIVMLLIAYQSILVGQNVVWFDPKNDFRSPKIILQASRLANKNCHFINLNPNQEPQFNLLSSCTEQEIQELFVAGFELSGKGSDGDFYRGKDEDASALSARIAITENVTSIPELIEKCSTVPEITEQENFWRMFKKLASLPAINTNKGLDIEQSILNGDVIYLIGSCDNERVKILQKMVLVRVMQIIKKRDRNNSTIPICVVLDEFKHIISPTALNALAVVRDFNSHFLLAHQSNGDLEESPSISKASAHGAVINNTALKVLFKIDDVDHAKAMSELAGEKPIYSENTNKLIPLSSKQNQSTGSWSQTKDYRIPHKVITSLPMPTDRSKQATVGIFYGADEPQIFYTGYIKAGNSEEPKTNLAEPYKSKKASTLIGSKELI